MLKEALTLLTCLKPPHMLENGDRENHERVQYFQFKEHRWRWCVFITLMSLITWSILHTMLAWGWSPAYAGFQTRSEAAAESSRTARIELRLLKQDLIATRTEQCRSDGKRFYTERLDDLLREYQLITGQTWRIPACAELTT
jgi:hypothetical protein